MYTYNNIISGSAEIKQCFYSELFRLSVRSDGTYKSVQDASVCPPIPGTKPLQTHQHHIWDPDPDQDERLLS